MQSVIDRNLWQEVVPPENFSGEVRFMESMREHTSLRIGGYADVLAYPDEIVSLKNLLSILKTRGIPFMTVGGGSNMLVSDNGIEGVVILLRSFNQIAVIEEDEYKVKLFVKAGTPLQKLVNFSKERGYAGLEGLAGIPGTTGGAVVGNSGAFGYEMRNVISSVTVMDYSGRLNTLDTKDMCFSYRSSGIRPDTVVLSSDIVLRKDSQTEISERVRGYIEERHLRQPVREFSAGCVFRNPENASAGRLIDEAGCKGMSAGDAEVSSKHANFFINRGNAKAADFIRLMDEVRAKVLAVSGIELKPEIRIVGRGC